MAKGIKKHSGKQKSQGKKLIDWISHTYTKRIKKWMFCPACNGGKMQINRALTHWQCEECGYILSISEYDDNYVFWFCDECNTYLNNQEGFDLKATKHICRKCGYENDTTFDNVKGICSDCGKKLPDAKSTLCIDCRIARREKAKKLIDAGLLVAGAILTVVALSGTDENESGPSSPLILPEDTDSDDDDIVYGLGPGRFPICKYCGSEMTGFDDWAWYTCPNCREKVRIIEGTETWYEEIFCQDKKQHYSDYALADFCRGGELSED